MCQDAKIGCAGRLASSGIAKPFWSRVTEKQHIFLLRISDKNAISRGFCSLIKMPFLEDFVHFPQGQPTFIYKKSPFTVVSVHVASLHKLARNTQGVRMSTCTTYYTIRPTVCTVGSRLARPSTHGQRVRQSSNHLCPDARKYVHIRCTAPRQFKSQYLRGF